jgi:hypothetical protein
VPIEHRSVDATPALVIREKIDLFDLSDWYVAARTELREQGSGPPVRELDLREPGDGSDDVETEIGWPVFRVGADSVDGLTFPQREGRESSHDNDRQPLPLHHDVLRAHGRKRQGARRGPLHDRRDRDRQRPHRPRP